MNSGSLFMDRQQQTGIGMIEILVTVVILSIGFLVAGRMQIQGMRFNQGAYFQSQAFFIAHDMVNRMRTNSDGVVAGRYNNVATSADAANPGCSNKPCDPEELALQDIYDLGAYFHARGDIPNFVPALPSAGEIIAQASVRPLNADLYTVELVWAGVEGGEFAEQNLSVNFALQRWE